jgi:hypothetical protein
MTVASDGEMTVTFVTWALVWGVTGEMAWAWMTEANSGPSCSRLIRCVTGVSELKKAVQAAVIVSSAGGGDGSGFELLPVQAAAAPLTAHASRIQQTNLRAFIPSSMREASVFPGPRGLCARVLGACTSGRCALAALLGIPGVPLGLLARLVLVGFRPRGQGRRRRPVPGRPVRAGLLRRLGRNAEADTACTAAISLTQNAAERAHLVRARAGPA